jgi:hypothetical protein
MFSTGSWVSLTRVLALVVAVGCVGTVKPAGREQAPPDEALPPAPGRPLPDAAPADRAPSDLAVAADLAVVPDLTVTVREAPDAGADLRLVDPSPPGAAVFTQDFEKLAAGTTWLKSCKWNKHVRVTEGCGLNGSKCLRVAQDPTRREPPLFPLPPEDERPPYPPGSAGVCFPYYTNTGTDVVQAVQPLPPALEYSLNYDVFFEPGYAWARAGKLPGLSATQWDSGCSIEGDGLKTDPGPARWSVRLMWREGGTSELYVYDQDRIPGACGLRGPGVVGLTIGRWIAVTIYVRLNSQAAAHDGGARLYLDGVLARQEEGLRLRASDTEASKITNLFFSTFHGGNESKRLYCRQNPEDPRYCAVKDPKIDTTWVPGQASYVDFDNVAVHAGLRIRMAPGQ